MLDILSFLEKPESLVILVEEIKAGNISIKWEEILADEDKLSSLHELIFGLLVQATDSIQSLNSEKLTPLIGKIFILNRQIEIAALSKDANLSNLCDQFEKTIREFTNLINPEKAIESINSFQENIDEKILPNAFFDACPLVTLIFALRMVIHAHEISDLDDNADDEDENDDDGVLYTCENSDKCEL